MKILWRGIHKLTEECGELLGVLGKLQVVPEGKHWDERYNPTPLRQRLIEEAGDVYAALDYLTQNALTMEELQAVQARKIYKRARYDTWVLDGVVVTEDSQHNRCPGQSCPGCGRPGCAQP